VIVDTGLADPLGEIFYCDERKFEVALHSGQWSDYVKAPSLHRPGVGDQLCELRAPPPPL
jgi:hypothetical protein